MKRLILASFALPLLAGCGIQGQLERPAPMWGEAREQYEAEQAAREAAEQQAAPPAPEPATPAPVQ